MNLLVPRRGDRPGRCRARPRSASPTSRSGIRSLSRVVRRQFVALASVLASGPRHLVLDEPTSQLDPEGSRSSATRSAAHASPAPAILMAEHKTDLLAGLVGPVVALDGGGWRSRDPTTCSRDPRLEASWASRLRRSSASPRGRRKPASRPRAVRRDKPVSSSTASASSIRMGREALSRRRPRVPPGLASRRSSARTDRGKSTLVRQSQRPPPADGRPVLIDGSDSRAGTSPISRASSAIAFQNPDRQIFAGRSGAEVDFGPGTSGLGARDVDRGDGARSRRSGSAASRRPIRTTSAIRAASSWRSPRSWRWNAQSSSSTSRPPARTRGASSGSTIVDELRGAGGP